RNSAIVMYLMSLCVSVFFIPFESSSSPSNERHLRRHHSHKLHIGFERKIGHVNYRVTDVLQIHPRLDSHRSVRLRNTVRHTLGHFSCRVADIDLTACDIVLPAVERYTFRQSCDRMLCCCVWCRVWPRHMRGNRTVIDDSPSTRLLRFHDLDCL